MNKIVDEHIKFGQHIFRKGVRKAYDFSGSDGRREGIGQTWQIINGHIKILGDGDLDNIRRLALTPFIGRKGVFVDVQDCIKFILRQIDRININIYWKK